MPTITLYAYVTSPFAMKVHSYLLYKKLPFTVYYVNPLKTKQQLPLGQQIPVLTVGDESRAESSAIGIWLDSLFPDTPALLPDDHEGDTDEGDDAKVSQASIEQRKTILQWDQWVSETLTPRVFYSIYPQVNRQFRQSITNTLRLGYCVQQTTTDGLPMGLRWFWPLLIRQAGFIRHIVAPLREQGTAPLLRKQLLSYLNEHLQNRSFLAETSRPALADLSAWPQLVLPSELGLSGLDDFKNYPHLLRWVAEVREYLTVSAGQPPLIPHELLSR